MPAVTPATGSPPVLEVAGLGVSLSGRAIFRDVTFSMAPGELAGLIGPNGAGKTTLLRAILGLLRPASGSVRIDGRRRSRGAVLVGYVPQKVLLDPDMPLRARDLVALGLDGHRLGARLRGMRARAALVEEMLAAVDATHLADRRIGVLSGGEQQRVLIAHALVSRPKLLLLDEPLANLDIHSEHEVVRLLARIADEQEIAVLLSAHDLNPLLAVMDQVIYVANGRAATGSVDTVVQPEVLSALYGHHVEVIRAGERVIVVAGDHAIVQLERAHPHPIEEKLPHPMSGGS